MGTPLLRFRSDEQLVALFRAGDEEAFRAIHDRYHKRLFAYARQMLPGRQDAEDALQDVFVRAYAGLRASDQQLALRAWLFRVAHNRCVDELRRPAPPAPEVLQLLRSTVHDPLAEVDLRESLRRLIEDIRRLPEQQRSALLMRELAGMSYADLSTSLGISVGAVKSLLVRARVALAQAAAARDTSCVLIREQLVEAHDRGMRPNATARKHMRDCVGCKSFRRELRGMSRQLAAITPAIGPLGILAKTLGFSGGAGGGGGLALLGGGGATASAGGMAIGVNHLAALLVAAAATAGGAVEIQHTIIPGAHHPVHSRPTKSRNHQTAGPAHTAPAIQAIVGVVEATVSTAPKLAVSADAPTGKAVKPKLRHKPTAGGAGMSPSTGASAVSNSSSTDPATGSDSTGTDASSTAGASTCSTLLASDSTSSGNSASSTPSSGTASSSPSSASVPCPVSSPPAGGTSSTGTGSSTSGSGASDTSTSSGSASGSSTSQSSTGTASTGGSSSATT